MNRLELLRAVVDAPDDDLPRLAYADYLDETGEDPARATFIRLDVEAGRIPLEHPARAAADRAARKLHLENSDRWAMELPANLLTHGRPHFSRGFAERVGVSAVWFAEHANELLLSAPVRDVDLTKPAPTDQGYTVFGGKAELHRIRWLDFAPDMLPRQMQDGTTNLGGVWHSTPTILDDLLSCPTMTGLRFLSLGINHLGPEGGLMLARRLPAAAFAGTLEVLDVSLCGLGAAGRAALEAAPRLPKLNKILFNSDVHVV